MARLSGVSAGAVLVLAAFVIAVLLVLPFGVIWSLNVLLGLSIAYGLTEWLAAFILVLIFGSSGASASK